MIVLRILIAADYGIGSPIISTGTTFARTEDARSQRVVNTTDGSRKLSGMLGEEQVTTRLSESLQLGNNIVINDFCRQLLPAVFQTYTVYLNPDHAILTTVNFIHCLDIRRCEYSSLITIGFLEPIQGFALIIIKSRSII